jgi:hypothetical protein
VKPAKIKVVREKRVKKTAEELHEAKKIRQKAYYNRKKPPHVKTQVMPRTSLVEMTKEQRVEHRTNLNRIRRDRLRAEGKPTRSITPEGRELRRIYWKNYYEQKKHDPDYILKRTTSKAKRLARMSLDT